MDMSSAILWNGQLIHRNKAVITASDHGFLYGIGLFETFRTYGGAPWLLERHAARLAEGCRRLGIAYEPNVAHMREGVATLLAACGLADGYIRWSVSAGADMDVVGLPRGAYTAPQEIVYAKALPPDDPASRPGKALQLLKLRRSSPEGAGPRLKSFHYMNNVLARRELQAAGADAATEGLFLDGDGYICEGIVGNVFWLKDGKLYTPSIETGALPGITRAYVMEMAAAGGIEVREGRYRLSDLTAADEVFLTNAVQEIVPVVSLMDEQGAVMRTFAAGTQTREWMLQYRARAERDD